MVEIDTLFQTKTAKKNIPFGAAHTYIACIRDYPPPLPFPGAKNGLQIMSLAASRRVLSPEAKAEVDNTLRDLLNNSSIYQSRIH